jgi:hypothetical protein
LKADASRKEAVERPIFAFLVSSLLDQVRIAAIAIDLSSIVIHWSKLRLYQIELKLG